MNILKYLPIFMISACSLQFKQDSKYEQNLSNIVANSAFNKSYKGIVLFETHNNLQGLGNLNPRNVLEFESDGGSKFIIDMVGTNYSSASTIYNVDYITPGKYKLVSAKAYDYQNFGKSSAWIDKKYDNLEASFTVNPGEIVYLGNLIIGARETKGDKLVYTTNVLSTLNNADKNAIEKLFNHQIVTRLMDVSHKQ